MHQLIHYRGIRAVLVVLGVLGCQRCRQSSSHRCHPSHLERQQVTDVTKGHPKQSLCPLRWATGNDYLSSAAYPSGPPLLGNHFLRAIQAGQDLPQRSFVLKSSPEVRGAPVDPGDQGSLNVLEDLAKTVRLRHCLPSDLSLLGSLGRQADHHCRYLAALVVLEVLLNLNRTRVQRL